MPSPLGIVSVQDLVDAHLLGREKAGERHVAPPTDYFFNGTRLGQEARNSLAPQAGDVIAYADRAGLHTFQARTR